MKLFIHSSPRTALVLLLAIFGWGLPCFAPGDSVEILPYLEHAITDLELGPQFAFLKEATPRDYRYLRHAALSRGGTDWSRLRSFRFHVTRQRSTLVMGAIGEMYLNAYARRWIQMHPGVEFVDSYAYDGSNPEGTRPDGLVIRRMADGTLIVEKIFEAKMGSSRYYPSQIKGAVRIWRQLGLTTPDGHHYPPDKVFVRDGGNLVSIKGLKLSEPAQFNRIEKNVVLFASEPKQGPFDGEEVFTPYTSDQLKNVTRRFLAYGYLGDRGTAKKADDLLKSRETAAPPSDDDRVIGDNTLFEFIKQHSKLPTPKEDAGLAQYMMNAGGRMRTFAEICDDETREQMARAGNAPAIFPMERWLVNVNLADNEDVAESVLSIYLRYYKKGEQVPLLDELRKNPQWVAFLKEHPVESLRRRGCASGLADLNSAP